MWPVLWRFVETILILYTIVSYVFVLHALWWGGGEKAKLIPVEGRLLFSFFAPFVLLLALFIPVPKEEK